MQAMILTLASPGEPLQRVDNRADPGSLGRRAPKLLDQLGEAGALEADVELEHGEAAPGRVRGIRRFVPWPHIAREVTPVDHPTREVLGYVPVPQDTVRIEDGDARAFEMGARGRRAFGTEGVTSLRRHVRRRDPAVHVERGSRDVRRLVRSEEQR